ncbi:MAG: LemA family protein [Bacteroides sp.]|nr:LemA family protein [Bacteroides sp.]
MKSNKTLITIGVIIVALFLLIVPTCSTYNSMVTLSEEVDQSWAEVENQYQRRHDLIPNLVNTVKGYAEHESSTLTRVTDARAGIAPVDTAGVMKAASKALNAPDPNAYASAMQELNRQFSIYVNAVHEAYPDLKANENFADLQAQLEGTENRVETARNNYTESVQKYNTQVRHFPGNIVAGMFGFSPKQQFQAERGAEKAPEVKF